MIMATCAEIKEKRAKLIQNARIIVDAAEADQRDLTADEKTKFDEIMTAADGAAAEVETAERKEKLALSEAELREKTQRKTKPILQNVSKYEFKESLRNWALAGTEYRNDSADALYAAANCGIGLNQRSINFRALSKGTDSAGGYSVPQDFSTEFEAALKYYFPVMSAVKTITTQDGRDMPFARSDDTANASAIVAESGSIGVATDPTFSKVTLKSWKYASPIVKVSLELLQDSSIDLEKYLAEEFANRFGRGYSAAVVSTNAGSAAPEGLLYGRTVATNLADGNAITLSKLMALETSVDIAYRTQPGAGWLMHDGTWAAIRQLADSTGFPIFLGDLQNSVQPQLLGYPVYIANEMTSHASPGDNAPLIAFGAFNKYLWRTCSNRVLTRLDELYAATGDVGFVMLERADGRYIGHTPVVKTLNSFDAA